MKTCRGKGLSPDLALAVTRFGNVNEGWQLRHTDETKISELEAQCKSKAARISLLGPSALSYLSPGSDITYVHV